MKRMRDDPVLIKTLEETGLPYEIVQRKKHRLIYVAGQRVSIIPLNHFEVKSRAALNVLSHIKRAARELA